MKTQLHHINKENANGKLLNSYDCTGKTPIIFPGKHGIFLLQRVLLLGKILLTSLLQNE